LGDRRKRSSLQRPARRVQRTEAARGTGRRRCRRAPRTGGRHRRRLEQHVARFGGRKP